MTCSSERHLLYFTRAGAHPRKKQTNKQATNTGQSSRAHCHACVTWQPPLPSPLPLLSTKTKMATQASSHAHHCQQAHTPARPFVAETKLLACMGHFSPASAPSLPGALGCGLLRGGEFLSGGADPGRMGGGAVELPASPLVVALTGPGVLGVPGAVMLPPCALLLLSCALLPPCAGLPCTLLSRAAPPCALPLSCALLACSPLSCVPLP
mmetsp:Transcript_12853/g.32777  ORF Transcript_12853/g.32777 Transcript_12853/m.32777 type:complete len:210 (+) Transcript_12853:3-632(+)